MAFRATNILPERGYEKAKDHAANLRQFAQGKVVQLASGGNSTQILNILDSLIGYRLNLIDIQSIPGIAAYARTQEDDSTYDVVAEFTALIALIEAGINDIVTTFPVDQSNFLLAEIFNIDGTRSPRNFTSSQLSGLVTVLTSIAAGIS